MWAQHPLRVLTTAAIVLVAPPTAWAIPSQSLRSFVADDQLPRLPALVPRQQCETVPVVFDELVTTSWAESILLVGSVDALGNWDPSRAVRLSADGYTAERPLWTANLALSPGSSFEYKFIRQGPDGQITWEVDRNHAYTVPNDCQSTATVTNTWQDTTLSTSSATITTRTASSTTTPKESCTNSPKSRACWANGYSIDTDPDYNWPNTGNTVSYDFTITNATLAPDGFQRQGFRINGQFPGPTIYANWGDTIQVTVRNQLENNGTAMHWHGMRMYYDNGQDGVPGVTECPIAPGQSKTYTFQATHYGTSWYHSHFSAQYGDGVWGSLVIYGPSTANYDLDLGPLPISDWYYPGTYATSALAMHRNALAPTADNGLINGTMVSASGGAYAKTRLTQGRIHRLRLVNTAVDNHFAFALDGHVMTVIAADFVPIVPYNASWVFIGIGQRYDVLINANQPPGSYWFRAEVQDSAGCGSNFQNDNIRSIFSYAGQESETPTSTATSYTKRCTDEEIVSYRNTFVPRGTIPSSLSQLETAINQSTAADGTLTIYWQVNGTPLRVDWGSPTLAKLNTDNTNYGRQANLIELPNEGVWTYWVITEGPGSPFTVNVPHPIHLHGHDFYVLGSGTGGWTDANRNNLNYRNPPRRDVAMLPSNGWLALAFLTDNPGAWLMHCHIAWHADDGFAVQFLESKSTAFQVDSLPSDFQSQCDVWNDYDSSNTAYVQSDSGI